MIERGKYIVIEGNDGTGKSEQVERLQQSLAKIGIDSIQVHEPDGAEGVTGATELRKIIKNGDIERDPWTNVLLFTAARRLNWLQAIQPALDQGKWVLAARNWYSTAVYQGYGEGVAVDAIKERTSQDVAEAYLRPDLALILSLDDEARTKRIDNRGELDTPDTFESKPQEFQDKLNAGYIDFAKQQQIPMIDASGTRAEVEQLVWHQVKQLTKG